MPEILRSFNLRPVELLSPDLVKSIGVHSHPANYQSEKFKHWLGLCKQNRADELRTEMVSYLRSEASIKKTDDLGEKWAKVIPLFLGAGNAITKERAYEIIKQSGLDTELGKEKSQFAARRMALADTILCLAYLKKLSYPGSMKYLPALKIMAFTERCIDLKMRLPEQSVIAYFDRRVVLPSCFSKIDPCSKPTDTAFSFLNDTGIKSRLDNTSFKGCTSEDCTCKTNDECVEQGRCCAKPRIDLIDLMVVKDFTKCYQPGELSYIKNVLEGESLSTQHRRLDRTEDFTETEENIRTFEEKYLQTEEKASLQKEAEAISKQDSSFDAGVTVTADWGTYKVVADANYSNNQSKSQTNKSVVNSSKDVVARAAKQVEEKVRKLESSRRIFETEEINKHKFKNQAGPNISGQYLYVNKVSRAQVYNYGRKAAIDIVLPEPASLYKKLFENKFKGVEPVKTALIEIDPKSITPANYVALVKQYDLKGVEPPPEEKKELVIPFGGGTGNPKKSWGTWYGSGAGTNDGPRGFTVPDGYVTESMETSFGAVSGNGHGLGISIGLTLGNVTLSTNITTGLKSVQLPALEGSQSVSVAHLNITYYSLDLIIRFKLKAEVLYEWQMSVLAKIDEVNEKALAEYDKALAAYKQEKEDFELKEAEVKKARYNKNPFINRETEKAELKRMIISYISCQFYDEFDAMKNKVKPCGYPEMDIREAETEGKFVQFFEQAFNWNLITYIFYPYFWGRKCTWGDKLKEESNDLIFEKFLAAGSCRALVPIRDGYFDHVYHFLAYGEIWGGSDTTPLPDDPHYVSIAQEIREQNQNFYADREGKIDVTNGTNTVVLNNSDHYWKYEVPEVPEVPATSTAPAIPAVPAIPAGLDELNINADLDREIILDCKVYRIVDIQPNTSVSTPTSWIITLERNYEGASASALMWSTGAVFVGAPWEFITPTTLTFLRDKSSCLPCYPLKECKEL